MKRLEENKARTRDEMICPNPDCLHNGLEAASIASEWSGDTAMIRGTKCPNPDCKYNNKVPEKEIKRQYVPRPLHKKILSSIKPNKLTVSQFIPIIFILLTIIFVGPLAAGINPIQLGLDAISVEKNVSGQAIGPDGEPLQNVDVYINDSSKLTKTNDNGQFTLKNVSGGEHELVVEPENESLGKRSVYVDISENNVSVEDVNGEQIQNNDGFTVQAYKLGQYSDKKTLNDNYTDEFIVGHQQNYEGYEIEIDVPSETQSYSEPINGKRTGIDITGDPVDEGKLEINFEGEQPQRNKTIQHTNQESKFVVNGNRKPSSVTISDIDFEASQQSEEISSNTDSETTISVNNNPRSKLKFTPTTTKATSKRTVAGTNLNPSTPVVFFTEENERFSTLTINGETTLNKTSIQRTTSDSQLTHRLNGNAGVENVSITVNSLVENTSETYSNSISSSSDETEKRKTQEVYTSNKKATITLKTNVTKETNPNGVTGGYYINNNFIEANNTTEINVGEGDEIGVWVQTEAEEISHSYTHDGEFTVERTEISRDKVEPGESIGVRASVRNPTGETRTETIRLFKDGEEVETEQVRLGPSEEELITVGRTTLETEKVYQINVNNGSAKQVQVGDAAENTARGTVTGEVTVRTDETSSVRLQFDDKTCSLESGESCSLNPTSQLISSEVTYRNADELTYTIDYTSVNNTKGVIIMNDSRQIVYNDKDVKISQNDSLELENVGENSNNLYVRTYQGKGEVTTELKKEGILENATISVNGETVYNDNITVDEIVELQNIDRGETYTVSINANNEYSGTLTWNETTESRPDSVIVNENKACETKIEECDITSETTLGTNTIDFTGFTGSLEYSVTYKEIYFSENATITTPDGQSRNVLNTDRNIDWNATTTIGLSKNTNEIIIEPNEKNTSVSGKLTYESTAPAADEVIIMLNGEEYETISTERDGTKTLTIEGGDLQKGQNTVKVVGDKEGVYTVQISRDVDYYNTSE